MKNIETAIEAIEMEKKLELDKLNEYDDLIARLKKLQDGSFEQQDNSENDHSSTSQVQNPKGGKELFKDYPYEASLSKKLVYLDSGFNRPFRSVEILNRIVEIEGQPVKEKIENQISQQINYMIHGKLRYIGQKYGANPYTFYFKVEWAEWNGKEYIIKPEYMITQQEFEAANVPLHKRKEFTWIVPKAVQNIMQPHSAPLSE